MFAASLSSGFDQQIDDSRALADDATERLPVINATIQQAVQNNSETLSVLEDVSNDYDSALGTINQLEDVVNSLQVKLTCFAQKEKYRLECEEDEAEEVNVPRLLSGDSMFCSSGNIWIFTVSRRRCE